METKKKKPCTNCGGSKHYTRWVTFNGDAHGLMPMPATERVPLVPFAKMAKDALCQLRICGNCGLAQWFLEKESIELIKEHYELEA